MLNPNEYRLALVILAAGSSSRMGQCKQLLAWSSSTLLEHCICQANASLATDVFIVLGSNKEEILNKIKLTQSQLIDNPNWEKGLSSSIVIACQELKNKNYDSLMFTLADQAHIDSLFLNSMIGKSIQNPQSIVASSYPKSLGVPAIFPAKFYQQLIQLEGEYGAKTLINANLEHCVSIQAKEKLIDIDTIEDYKRYK